VYGFGAPVMSLPMPEWASRKLLANASAAGERSLSQMSMPSSLTEKATSGGAVGCVVAHAASSALMIGPSGMRVSADGVCGDWPCFADRMITVERVSPCSRIASTIAPIFWLT
jgi:hypothetical protein